MQTVPDAYINVAVCGEPNTLKGSVLVYTLDHLVNVTKLGKDPTSLTAD
jgi:hypothetical protein